MATVPRAHRVWAALALAFAALGLFLAAWIVVPAPTALLLPLGVLVPELAPFVTIWGVIAVGLGARRGLGEPARWLVQGCGAATLALSSIPRVGPMGYRFDRAMEEALGRLYLDAIPAPVRRTMRPEPFRLRDVLSPLAAGGGESAALRVERDVRYASPRGTPLLLDVYHSSEPGARPTLIVVPGGGWRTSSRRQGEPLQRYMAARGYTVVAISYRTAPRDRFPAQLEDVRAAIAFVRANAGALGVDPGRVALVGASAGAHLALLAAYEPGAPPIRGVVNYYGPSDLDAGYRDVPRPDPYDVRAVLRDFVGGPPSALAARYAAASPVSYVRPGLPPTLHMYGGRDHIVKPRFGRELHARLRAVDDTSVYLEVPWSEHGFNALLSGTGGQLSLYYSERFLAWAMARGN